MMVMEGYEENKNEEEPELMDIASEISKLSEEVSALKDNIKTPKKRSKSDKSSKVKQSPQIELSPAIGYVNELLENSSEVIISEMKSEFFRLFNFLSSMFSVTPYQSMGRTIPRKEDSMEDSAVKQVVSTSEFQKEKEMMQLLLEERESLVYELSDQIVAIEAEKKVLEDKMQEIEKDKAKWNTQKNILERIVTTDPRFNIITLLRRMGVIAPIQLSFVLGVSLSQTRRYISELEQIKILQVKDDGTVSLHPDFDEDSMNIKIQE
ncbi:MAG: hypothetical protein GOP50_08445 [Candidatus Heimdallarchaeota archaeon]|nr:hypothetical protein [Candidatus Heimdallarchaeota archaeon]